MRVIHTLVTHSALALQVASPLAGLLTTAPIAAQANVGSNVPYEIKLDTAQAQPVVILQAPKPNFDNDVLAPLRIQQEAQAAKARAAKKARRAKSVVQPAAAGGDAFYRLRLCESGGNYQRNSGNGYFGAYQYNISTWAGYGGYARADLAPASVQDAKARADQARRGWTPWASCARRLDLM